MQYVIEINGVDVGETDKTYTIPINTNSFDTIKYSFNNNSTNWAIMKLRHDVKYELLSNSCSFYTIKPKVQPKQGMIQFKINSKDTISYLVGIAGFDMRKLNKNQIDKFYYTPPSAMCPYSAKSIEIQTINQETIGRIRYHFLHGELLGIEFNENDNSIEINLYGYIRDKRDYRYRYQNKE